MKFKVKNKLDDVRKFRDGNTGKDIFVEPGKSVLTERPPKPSEVWKVEVFEEKEWKKKPLKKVLIEKKVLIKRKKIKEEDK